MMTIRRFVRVILLAAGIFLLASSSGMAKPVQAPSEVTVQALLPLILKKTVFGNGTVTGTIINASLPVGPDHVVAGAQVCWGAQCDLSNGNGIYHIHNVASGIQNLTASADGFITITQEVSIIGNTVNYQDIAIVPDVAKSGLNYRIMVTWDTTPCWPDPNGIDCWPNDLDAHLWLREINQPIGYHIGYYYHYDPNSNQDDYWLDKGTCYGFPNACLEYDATQGSGPETIAIKESEISMYYFGVFNVNQGRPGVPPISLTGARVRLYGLAGLIRTYDVPVNGGDNIFWYVFSLNGETGVVTDQNCIIDYSNDPPVCP